MNSSPSVAESPARRWLRGSYAGLLLIIGLTLAVGGVMLLIDGGSFYYLFAGLAISASAILVGRRDSRGRWLYGAFLIVTVAWAIWEVGFDAWGLVARLVALFVIALPLVLPGLGLGTHTASAGTY
jgi:quinoprotein glucose dehydrogenase